MENHLLNGFALGAAVFWDRNEIDSKEYQKLSTANVDLHNQLQKMQTTVDELAGRFRKFEGRFYQHIQEEDEPEDKGKDLNTFKPKYL